MNVVNFILLIIGLFNWVIGTFCTTRDKLNIVMKLLFTISGAYSIIYSLYLSGVFR